MLVLGYPSSPDAEPGTYSASSGCESTQVAPLAWQRPARGGGDDGLRRAAWRGEGGAQSLVPADHLVERAGEEGGGERARDVDGVEEVAGCRAGVDLVEEPHSLLGEGERADRFLLKRRHTRAHGLSGQRAGRSFRQGFHDQRASHGGGPAGYCPPPRSWER